MCSSNFDNICIGIRLGSLSRELSVSWLMARPVSIKTYKLVGNESSAVSTSTFCQDSTQQSCASQNRQCYSGELYKKASQDTFPISVLSDMGDIELCIVHKVMMQAVHIPGKQNS